MRAAVAGILIVAGLGLWMLHDRAPENMGRTEHTDRSGRAKREAERTQGSAGRETGTAQRLGSRRETSPSVLPEARAAAPMRSRWEVVLLGPGDVALPGVPVRVHPKGDAGTTDSSGRVVLHGPPRDTVLDVTTPFDRHRVELTEPRTVLRYPDLLPAEIRTVNGATGRTLDGVRVVFTSPAGDLAPNEGGMLRHSPFRRGAGDMQSLEVRTPGWATRSGLSFKLDCAISPFAHKVVVTVPLFREFAWTVQLPAGLTPFDTGLARGDVSPRFQQGARHGEVRVQGLPFLPGEEAVVTVKNGPNAYIARHRMIAPKATTVLSDLDQLETFLYLDARGFGIGATEPVPSARGVWTERSGRTARIHVRDARGKPWSFVRVKVIHDETRRPYGVVRHGVQAVPLLTDANGRLELPGLGQERVRIGFGFDRQLTEWIPRNHSGVLEVEAPR